MSDDGNTLTVLIPLAVKPRGGRKAIITPPVLEVEARHDITLIKAVARAFRWLRMLESGKFTTIRELAAAEKINASYVSRILRLTLLAPNVVEAILDGRQLEGMSLPGLMEGGGDGLARIEGRTTMTPKSPAGLAAMGRSPGNSKSNGEGRT